MAKHLDSVSYYFGKSYTGKTARLLHELRNESRVIFLDGKCSQLVKLAGWHHFWPQLSDGGRWIRGPWYDFLLDTRSFRIMFHFRSEHNENLELSCRVALSLKNCVLACDELGIFLPLGARPGAELQSVVISGSHDGLKFAGTAQRPSLVHPTARANASRMFLFRMTEQNDLDVMRTYLPPDFYSSLPSLPDYTPILWADGFPPYIDCSLAGKLHNLPDSRT